MAIGSGFTGESNVSNQGNKNGSVERNYYSRFKIKDDDTKNTLSVSFRSTGLLVLEINQLVDGFKYDSLTSIFISQYKAQIYANEIKKFLELLKAGKVKDNNGFGIIVGLPGKETFSNIYQANGNVYLAIGKLDENEKVTSLHSIKLNTIDYYTALEVEDVNNVTKETVSLVSYSYLEIEQLISLLEDFARSMTGAFAYAQADLTRYDHARILGKMDPIYDKLGIERLSNVQRNYSAGGGFTSGIKHIDQTSIDDIEGLME